jgi:hypothetical protein
MLVAGGIAAVSGGATTQASGRQVATSQDGHFRERTSFQLSSERLSPIKRAQFSHQMGPFQN